VSPLERHDPKLRQLEIDASGAPPPEDPDAEDELVDSLSPEEIDEAEIDEEEEEYEEMEARAEERAKGPKVPGPFHRLYHGQTSFDFVGRRRVWFTISSIIIVAGIISLGFRGLNLGIDFKGGSSWEVAAPGVTQSQVTSAVTAAGLSQPTVELLGRGGSQKVEVQADLNSETQAEQAATTARVTAAMAKLGSTDAAAVSVSNVGPTWGGQVTQRALTALIAFFVLVAIYTSFRFEPKMAVAAFIAMIHDLLVTIGVYSLFGFQVTPDTVIAILTILGYSLYDTVVVFDRVRDNTKGVGASGRMSYSEMINLSMNQTLARSINTSLVAILPVLAVLVVGAELLGATTLQDYGLALFVGLLSGAYSSIFIAAPVLAILKEREPRYVAIRQRIQAKGQRAGALTPAAAAALTTAGGASTRAAREAASTGGTIKPGAGARNAAARDAAVAAGAAAVATNRPPPRPRKPSKNKKRR